MATFQWTETTLLEHFARPLFQLVAQAYAEHTKQFPDEEVELCTLSSIKTGACPEDCAYCPQSGHHNTGLKREKLQPIEVVLMQAKRAKANGAKRFCMGAAWKNPPKKDFEKVQTMVKEVKALGLETCVTLGQLDQEQAEGLKEAGLDYYNHNLDCSPEFYPSIISTRTFQDRLDTLEHVANAGINVCCGGIFGMGESRLDRVCFLLALYALPTAPKSIPINKLIAIKGTPLENAPEIDTFELIKSIAMTRLMFPEARIRLSAGRENMSEEAQAWCFMAGANSIFLGEKLLTTPLPTPSEDLALLKKLQLIGKKETAHAE